MTTANGHYHRRWLTVGLSMLALFVVLGVVVFRLLGENARIDARIAANNAEIRQNQQRIETELQADCPFKMAIIELPGKMLDAGRTPPDFILAPAHAAKLAYIRKHCAEADDPDTGKPFGPAPEVRDR